MEREAGRGPLDVEADDKATPVVEAPVEPAHGGDPVARVNGARSGERGKVAVIDADGVGVMGGRGAVEVDGDGASICMDLGSSTRRLFCGSEATVARQYCTDAGFWCFVSRRLVPCCYRTSFSHLSKLI